MRQKSIEVKGLEHNAPIPLGCRIGPILATSGIGGKDPASGKLPPEPERQAFHCFDNLKRILAAGGLDLGDVVKLTVFVVDEAHRDVINKFWNECYPDARQRPARHTLVAPLRGGQLMQLEALAVSKDLE